MKSILNEIRKLRRNDYLKIDYYNDNRYRIIVDNINGTKSAYCFSTPIYNYLSKK